MGTSYQIYCGTYLKVKKKVIPNGETKKIRVDSITGDEIRSSPDWKFNQFTGNPIIEKEITIDKTVASWAEFRDHIEMPDTERLTDTNRVEENFFLVVSNLKMKYGNWIHAYNETSVEINGRFRDDSLQEFEDKFSEEIEALKTFFDEVCLCFGVISFSF